MKAGKYTAALLLLVVGSLLLVDLIMDKNLTRLAIDWWPVALIALGLEYMFVTLRNRDTGKKVGLAFGSLILAAGISVAAIAFTNAADLSFLRNWNINIGSISFADENGYRHDMDTMAINPDQQVHTIALRNHNGNVSLQTGDVAEIELDAVVFVHKSVSNPAEIAEQTEIKLEQKGDELLILPQGKEYRMFGAKQRPRINLSITVPRDADHNWRLDLTNGRVEADGLTVRDRLVADTTNGSVNIRNIVGNVVGDTTNGTVTITGVQGDVVGDTTNGKVILSDITGNAVGDTTNGEVRMTNISGNASGDTTNGGVTLERIGGTVKADTTHGTVRVTDAAGSMSVSTTNGDIIVRTETVGGDYRFDSANGKVNLHLPADASIDVRGETSWGSIMSDFGLRADRKKLNGSANGGQYKIVIDTNSSINIHASE